MGAAEDAVRRRQDRTAQGARNREAQRRATCIREIPSLVSQAVDNLARHDYLRPNQALPWMLSLAFCD